MAAAVELAGISKRFGAVRANRSVSLTIAHGSIHGIVGENGAGKTTLMNILYGYYRPDSGEIRIDGRRAALRGPQDAIALGVGMVHQHFTLADAFTVLENVVLGAEGGFALRRGLTRARRALERLARDRGLAIDPDAIAGDLSVGPRQRVEIAKALYRGARILILDEPTAVLTPGEAEELFGILRALRREGRAIVLITHKLREILALTDRVTVMRGGRAVATLNTAETDRGRLAELAIGRAAPAPAARRAAAAGAVVLEVARLEARDRSGAPRVRGASLAVRAGEIVGIAGVAGNGQSELLEAIAGSLPAQGGEVRLKGAALPLDGRAASARARREAGLAHLPEDSLRAGSIGDFDASENTILGYHRDPRYGRGPWLSRRAALAAARRAMARFDVRPALPRLRMAHFSGGNRQKLVVGRELGRAPDVLLAGQPTRGMDVGAAAFIHRQLADMRDRGGAILLVSVELDEILALSDRVLAMYNGAIVYEAARAEADARALGAAMAGAAGGGTRA